MTTIQKLLHSVFSPPRPISEPKHEDHNNNSTQTGISSASNVYPQVRFSDSGGVHRAPDTGDELRGVKEDRCQFTFSDGRQCRNQHAQLCVHHSSRKDREGRGNGLPDFPPRRNVYPQDELSPLKDAALEALCSDLTTSTNINRALSQVFLLMAQGRISQKQAVAFGYITQLLLQTVPGIRSEYVSVHGYRDWENRLKTSLMQNTNKAPDPSPEGGGEEQEPSRDTNEQPINGVVDHPTRMVAASEQRERGASPDFADIFRRSRDMMAGKYDTTPEGRREANTLSLELELMNPAPAKPRKGFFGRTVALVRRLREHQTKKSGAASQPPPAPAPTTAPVPSSTTPAPPPPVAAFEAAAKAAFPAAITSPSPSDAIAPENNFVEPRSRRPTEKVSEQPSDQYPKTRPKQEMPVPGITLARTGHTTAWYAPASWSAPRPDPFPSRKEKLWRSLQAMGDRPRQHQMQNRSFWR